MYYGEFDGFEEQAEKIEVAVKKVMKIPSDVEIELFIVDTLEMKKLNFDSRGIGKETDVLSFPTLDLFEKSFKVKNHTLDINPETNKLMLGTIVICREVMEKQAEEYETFEREFSYLLTHGTLHLLGYDHMQEKEKARMRKKEEKVLKCAKI